MNIAAPAALPEKIGPYRVIRRIGAGGMGVVYEAQQAEPSRRVAVKVVRAPVGADPHHHRLFQREIQILGRLRHPAIAQIYDAGHTKDGQQYFVMELVDGRPLVEFCELADLSLRDRLSLFAEVCNAVQYAHQRGVIHSDFRPGWGSRDPQENATREFLAHDRPYVAVDLLQHHVRGKNLSPTLVLDALELLVRSSPDEKDQRRLSAPRSMGQTRSRWPRPSIILCGASLEDGAPEGPDLPLRLQRRRPRRILGTP